MGQGLFRSLHFWKYLRLADISDGHHSRTVELILEHIFLITSALMSDCRYLGNIKIGIIYMLTPFSLNYR